MVFPRCVQLWLFNSSKSRISHSILHYITHYCNLIKTLYFDLSFERWYNTCSTITIELDRVCRCSLYTNKTHILTFNLVCTDKNHQKRSRLWTSEQWNVCNAHFCFYMRAESSRLSLLTSTGCTVYPSRFAWPKDNRLQKRNENAAARSPVLGWFLSSYYLNDPTWVQGHLPTCLRILRPFFCNKKGTKVNFAIFYN